MKDIQEVFLRIHEASKERRQIKNQYKDTLTNLAEYKDIMDQIKTLQLKKKQVELSIQSQFASELEKLEALETTIKGDAILLSDLALTTLVKGEPVAVTDNDNNEYEPIFNVKFKKAS